jgi:hypothetical protein
VASRAASAPGNSAAERITRDGRLSVVRVSRASSALTEAAVAVLVFLA